MLRPHPQAAPATGLAALPPLRRLPTLFHPPVLSHGGARPSTITRAHRPGSRGPRAACRLLQSLRPPSTTAGSIEPRSPRPESPPNPAPRSLLRACEARVAEPLSEPNQPRGHRSGTGEAQSLCPASPAAIARSESFAPTRSARTPSVADPCRRMNGESYAESPRFEGLHGPAQADLALRRDCEATPWKTTSQHRCAPRCSGRMS